MARKTQKKDQSATRNAINADVEAGISPERAREIMDDRARALARVPAKTLAADETVEVVTFMLASERCVIESRYVREVIRLVDFTPVPGAPDFLIGVINFHSNILPVINIRGIFNVPATIQSDLSRVIIIGREAADFGILVDDMEGLADIHLDELAMLPQPETWAGHELLKGITKDAKIVLDGAKLIDDDRFFATGRSA